MNMFRLTVLMVLLVVTPVLTGCAGLGVSRTGKRFNYENVTKIQEGVTTKAEIKQLLNGVDYEGVPTRTGRQAATGFEEWNYSYSETAGTTAWMRYIPFLSSVSVGKSTVTQYTCNVRFDGDVVANYDYDKIETGTESAGI